VQELTAQAVPVDMRQIKCCAFQEAVGRLFDLWQVRVTGAPPINLTGASVRRCGARWFRLRSMRTRALLSLSLSLRRGREHIAPQEVLLPPGALRTFNGARQHVTQLEADGVALAVLAARLRRFQAALHETMPAAAEQCARLLVTLQRLQKYRD